MKSTIIGLSASAIILVVLGIARLFVVDMEVPELSIREIETVTLESPPPPPPKADETPPPPAPSLSQISLLPDPTQSPIPKVDVPMDIKTPIENFFTDVAPAPLPTALSSPVPNPSKKVVSTPSPKKITPKPAAPKPQVAKSHYNSNELDSRPRLLRYNPAEFPDTLRRKGVSQGTVVLQVELSESGSVRVMSLVSSTHPELVTAARKVASGARYTPPKRSGQPVKAIMQWPITFKK